MPRWPEGHVTKRTCPDCGGKKDFDASRCRACTPYASPLAGRTGADHPAWKGGRLVDRDGYVRLYLPAYRFARANGYVLEHVKVIEDSIGRRLRSVERVHHKDGDRQNNQLENLAVLSPSEHSRLHRKQDVSRRRRDDLGRFTSN